MKRTHASGRVHYSDFSVLGVEKADVPPTQYVFHSGTATNEAGDLVTNGGRVLITVALSNQLASAVAKATAACRAIQFSGAQFRRDIAAKGIARYVYSSRIRTPGSTPTRRSF